MSREIKFRAWDTKNNCYEQGNLLFEIKGPTPKDRWELEQYTGLKDKNGKEIYEGDICKDQRGYVGKIVWVPNEAGFGFYEYHVRDDGFGLGCMPLSRLRLEILGNIHENPELLEAGV